MRTQIHLYLRVRLPDGSHLYLRAAHAKNGRIRSGFGIHQGRAVEFPAAPTTFGTRRG